MPRRPPPLPKAAKNVEGLIRSTVRQGMTGKASLSALRSQGVRIRDSSFYQARKRFQAEFAAGRSITARRGSQMVRSSSLPPAYYDTNQQNQAVVELTFTDIETGDEYAVNKTVSWSGSNTKDGIDQAVDEMRRHIKYGTNEDMQGEFEGYEVVSAVQRSTT